MKRTISVIVSLVVLVSLFTSCTGKDDEVVNISKEIQKEAETMVEDILSQYNRYGIEITKSEVTDLELAAEVSYSGGGTFQFYEIGFKALPKTKDSISKAEKMYNIKFNLDEQGWIVQKTRQNGEDEKKLFLSVYNDKEKLCEFRKYRGIDFEQPFKEGKYNKEAFENIVRYVYEEASVLPIEEEYSFNINNKVYSLGQNLKGKTVLDEAELEKKDTEDLMYILAGYREVQKSEDTYIETYGYFENHYEPIVSMFTENSQVETSRGIKVGDTEEELFEKYGQENLVFSSKSFGGESFTGFAVKDGLVTDDKEWSCYGFTGEDLTNNYVLFFMDRGKVWAIEMGSGFDYKPFKKEKGEYSFEIEDFINDHIDEKDIMRYDISIPKVKESTLGSQSINLLIQRDFEKFITFSEDNRYEPLNMGFNYPWVQIEYSVSNLNGVSVLNVFSNYSSALGSGRDRYVNSYYYDTTCGARMSQDAALYKLGFSKEMIESYFRVKEQTAYEDLGKDSGKFENIIFYFNEAGEPRFLVNGLS